MSSWKSGSFFGKKVEKLSYEPVLLRTEGAWKLSHRERDGTSLP